MIKPLKNKINYYTIIKSIFKIFVKEADEIISLRISNI